MEEIISFKNISKNFGGVKALVDVSFGIKKGRVHAIVGENGAGKSTLMNILSGMYMQDEGVLEYKGEEVRIANPHHARSLGIGTVYQELKNCQNLTVSENIFLGREEKKGLSPDWKSMNDKAARIMQAYGLNINEKTVLKNLTVAQMQLVEIAKAIELHADVLILDEPTSALTINETKKLFANIERLRDEGVTILFISHRLEEVFSIADEISVLRNGTYLGTYARKDISVDEVIKLIAGRELIDEYQHQLKRKNSFDKKVLEVKNFSCRNFVHKVSFNLYEGEILGFYGLQGSGRSELMESLFGINSSKKDSGSVYLYGRQQKVLNSGSSIQNKMVMVTEDRKISGLFFNMDINDNIAVIHNRDITKAGFINTRRINGITNEYIKKLSIKCSSLKQKVSQLSGGNQQKVIISRCLSTQPNIIIMDEPTRGVDVGAKAEIYEILRQLRENEKKSIIIISSELPEIILLCDRVVVMNNGAVTGELTHDEINEERILQCAFNE